MRKSRLVRAVMVLWLLYATIAMGLFMFLPPRTLAGMYDALPAFMATLPRPESLSLAHMDTWQRLLFAAWSLPVFLAWLAAMGLGVIVARLALFAVGERFRKRAEGSAAWKGTRSTLGPLLTPSLPHAPKAIDVALEGVDLTKTQQAFIDEAMGLLAEKPDTFAGDGHGVGLYEHTLHVLERAVDHPDSDALLVMAAAVHDLGKLTSYKLVGENHQRIRDHGIEGGRLIRQLPTFQNLPEAEAEAVFLVARYEHCPDQMPRDTRQSVKTLLARLSSIDGEATAVEKEKTLEQRDPQTEIMDAFDRYLGDMPFYRKNLSGKPKTVGQRHGRRLYLNEHALRDWLQARLDRDFSAALGKVRHGGEIHAITTLLLRGFHARGWLVTEITAEGKKYTLPPECALWTVQAGKAKFNGMFIVRIPEDSPIILPEAVPHSVKPLRPVGGLPEGVITVTTLEGPESGDSSSKEDDKPAKPKPATGRKQRSKRKPKAVEESRDKEQQPPREPRQGPWSDDEVQLVRDNVAKGKAVCVSIVAEATGRKERAVERKYKEIRDELKAQEASESPAPNKQAAPDAEGNVQAHRATDEQPVAAPAESESQSDQPDDEAESQAAKAGDNDDQLALPIDSDDEIDAAFDDEETEDVI